MAAIYGELLKAQLENAAADLSNVTGLIYYNTADAAPKIYAGGWDHIVMRTKTETLTNKTLSTPTLTTPLHSSYSDFTEVAAPATPAAGTVRVYAKADGKIYRKDDGGTESELGGGSAGVDLINYVTNSNFEVDVTTGVSATNVTSAAETTNPLIGSQSHKLTSQASTGTVDYSLNTIDNHVIDGARTLRVYGRFTSDASDSDGDWAVGVYNSTDTVYAHGPVDLPGNTTGTFALDFVPVTGKTYVIRLTRTISTASRVLLLDDLRCSDLPNLTPVKGFARHRTIGTSTGSATYGSINNVPRGWYRVHFGCFAAKAITGENAQVFAQENGTTIAYGGRDYIAGASQGTTVYGASTTVLHYFPNAVNTFRIGIFTNSGSSYIQDPYYYLEAAPENEDYSSVWA